MPAVRRNVLTLGLLAVVGCGSQGQSAGPRRPGGEWLKSIQFEGNEKIEDESLVSGLALQRTQARGRAPDPYLVQVDEDRIRGEYLRRGYLSVDVRSRVERQGDATTVIYSIDEGVRARTKVVITGLPDDPAISKAKVRETLPLADNAPFDYEVYDQAKAPLEAVVEDAGYAHVKLDSQIVADRANATAIVQLDYDTGPKTTFGTVEVTGVEGDLRDAVENRIQFEPGQQYSASAIAATQRALYGLNRFSTVRVQPVKDDPTSAVVAVQIAVDQGARREVKLGGGFGIDPASYEVRGRAGYMVQGWPYALDTLTIDLRPAYALLRDTTEYEPRIRALVKIERQDLFWTYARGEVEGGFNYIAYEAYTSYGPRALLGFSTPIVGETLSLRVGWGIQRNDFRNFHPLIDENLQMQIGVDETARVAAFTQAVVLDLRDNPIDTQFGIYGELRLAEGTRFAGSAYDYVQVVPELRGFLPVPIAGVVLAAKIRTGTVFGELAPSERFFSGGASNQRGFPERKLAPSAFGLVDGDLRSIPYGGGTMFETSIEARIPITTVREMPFGAVAFLDGGDVTETRGELDLTNLHWAAGLGLRLQTIVGAARFDVGYRLNRTGPMEPDPNSKFAFHLSLGEAF